MMTEDDGFLGRQHVIHPVLQLDRRTDCLGREAENLAPKPFAVSVIGHEETHACPKCDQ